MIRRVSLPLILASALAFAALPACAAGSNDAFGDEPLRPLAGPARVEISGAVESPVAVDLAGLPLHSVVVRETGLAADGKPAFTGAYRYEGVSLLDLLKPVRVKKPNVKEFNLDLDLLVLVEGEAGERAVFSWGEIFYTANPHRILIATAAASITPAKTGEAWPLPRDRKLVAATDTASVRNVSRPKRIVLFPAAFSDPATRKGAPLKSPGIDLFDRRDRRVGRIDALPAGLETHRCPTVFYGHGMGFHGFETFAGPRLSDLLVPGRYRADAKTLRLGYFVIAAADGYRIAVSASELLNRNDPADFILVDRGADGDGGRFVVFPPADFFADRAIKAVKSIRLRHAR